MTEILLLSLADVRAVKQISKQINEDDFNARVRNVQRLNLINLLGNAFYTDLMSNIENVIYNNLINGTEYTNTEGVVNYFGLKRFLAWHVLADLLSDNSIKISDLGNVNATGNNFNLSDGSDTARVQKEYLTNALYERNEIIKFLDFNYSSYEFWESTQSLNKSNEFYFNIL